MKLRIRGNSIRLRLSQGEVTVLMASGAVREEVHFSSTTAGHLTYSILLSQTASVLAATFMQGDILVTLPIALAKKWAESDQTGIEHTQSVGNGLAGNAMELRIAVEKDFRCLQPRPDAEEAKAEADNFPHPNPASCG